MDADMMEQTLSKIAELVRGSGIGMMVKVGDPQLNAQWDIPYIAIAPISEDEEPYTTGKNKVVMGVTAYLVVSGKSNMRSDSLDSDVDLDLIRKVEAVKAILRGNVTLEGQVLMYRSLAVRYRSGLRGGEGIRVGQIGATYEVGRSR